MSVKKSKIILVLFIMLVLFLTQILYVSATNTKTIAFDDENLYIQVKNALGDKIKSFDNDSKCITVDINEIKELRLTQNGIKSINGIEQFTNLEELTINNAKAISEVGEDVHPVSAYKLDNIDKLSDLKFLKKLSLRYCQLDDNDMEQISKIVYLTDLDLSYNQISDVSKLNKLKNLKSLHLTGNNIEDINELNGLTNITYLYIDQNNISDISAVVNMKELQSLNFSKNKVKDISIVSGLGNLLSIDFKENEVENIECISNLKLLKSIQLSDNCIGDFSALLKLPKLKISDDSINKIGKQKIEITVRDGDTVKLPPVIKQSFEMFDSAESLDCINCTVSKDYTTCKINPNVDAARIRISKGTMADTIIILKPGEYTEERYKLSQLEKRQVENTSNNSVVVSIPKNLAIVIAIIVIGLWVGTIVYIFKR